MVSIPLVKITILLESLEGEHIFPLIATRQEKLEGLEYGKKHFITSNSIEMNLKSIITNGQMLNLPFQLLKRSLERHSNQENVLLR